MDSATARTGEVRLRGRPGRITAGLNQWTEPPRFGTVRPPVQIPDQFSLTQPPKLALAKGAVEGDLGEGGTENGELLVVQLSEE